MHKQNKRFALRIYSRFPVQISMMYLGEDSAGQGLCARCPAWDVGSSATIPCRGRDHERAALSPYLSNAPGH